MVFDFYGPDANLLLSDAFVREHCFSVIPATRDDPRLIGLAFQPVAGRTLPDISGVLWLDRTSAELRYVDYRYENLPLDVLADRAGGRVEFARLADGRWIVSRWQIRTPRLASVPANQVGTVSVSRRYEVIGYKEEGANILDLDARDKSTSRESLARVSGVAYDSLRHAPLSGVLVSLDGTSARDTTDDLGRYQVGTRISGDYVLRFEHEQFRQLGIRSDTHVVRLNPGSDIRVNAAVPSFSTLRRRLCSHPLPRVSPLETATLLFGVVREASGEVPASGAQVRIWWASAAVTRSGTLVGVSQRADTVDVEGDSAGAFVVCGVPRDVEIRLRVMPHGPIVHHTFDRLDSTAHVRLVAGRSPGRTFLVRGRITSSATGQPLASVEVSLTELSESTRSDSDGGFAFPRIPTGRFDLRLRRVGYVALRHSLVVDEDGIPPLLLSMTPLAPELAEVTVAGERSRGSLTDFERRRSAGSGGTFLDRAMLDARDGSTLSDVLRAKASSIRLVRRREGGRAAAGQRSQGSSDARAPQVCYMQVIVDGVRVFTPSQVASGNPPPNIDEYAPNSLEGVEVYAGPAQTPTEFGGREATCGTLVLWTRQR